MEASVNNRVGLTIDEQETHIYYMRDESFARIYTSDATQINKFNKLCKDYPEVYQLVEEGKYGNKYICKDKSMVAFRKKKRVISEEAKETARIRMMEYHKAKNKQVGETQ